MIWPSGWTAGRHRPPFGAVWNVNGCGSAGAKSTRTLITMRQDARETAVVVLEPRAAAE
jgi:hypothetical protein